MNLFAPDAEEFERPTALRAMTWIRLLLGWTLAPVFLLAEVSRELDLSNLQVPVEEVGSGGVPIDAIPAIDDPKFVSVAEADRLLNNGDQVISVRDGESARAYPLRILDWHEIVNDEINGQAVAVTYCPLCATGMVFSREFEGAAGGRLDFGVSGLLHNSVVLMYDRESMSLWSQLAMRAVSGRFAGRELAWLPSRQMTWKAWKERFPAGRVLSHKTGYNRNYHHSAYYDYHRAALPIFEVPSHRSDLSPKARVIGIVLDGQARAYRVSGLRTGVFSDQIGIYPLEITYHRSDRLLEVRTEEGELIPSVQVYWFAWQAFYPDTSLVRKLR